MAKNLRWLRPPAVLILATGLAFCSTFSFAVDDASTGSPTADSALYVKVHLSNPVKMSKSKPGDIVEGSLWRDVYSSDRKLFPAGSHVRLTIDHLERRRRERNDHWPWVINAFTPRHENYPVFKTATVAGADGESSLQVSLISVSRMRDVHAKAKKGKSKPQSAEEHGAVEVGKSNQKKLATPTMVLEASSIEGPAAAENKNEPAEPTLPTPETLPAGTQCKILLLGGVSASKSKPGDVVRARLLEPVVLNSKLVLPAGSLFEGRVVKKTPPRWLSRSGSLYLTFTDLTLPGGNHFPITASRRSGTGRTIAHENGLRRPIARRASRQSLDGDQPRCNCGNRQGGRRRDAGRH